MRRVAGKCRWTALMATGSVERSEGSGSPPENENARRSGGHSAREPSGSAGEETQHGVHQDFPVRSPQEGLKREAQENH
jgi:hypothetical protein